jgi:hypothetical protein
MRTLFSGGLAVFAGMVCFPADISTGQARAAYSRDYGNDPRLESLKSFFGRAACPAWQYAAAFLEAADVYELDWRLLPSISYVESTGGKAAVNNNLFGWDSGRARFQSVIAGIHAVGYHLAHSELYRDKDVNGILATYNPDTTYAAKVKWVMRQIAARE